MNCDILCVPPEILAKILLYFKPKYLASILTTCSYFNESVMTNLHIFDTNGNYFSNLHEYYKESKLPVSKKLHNAIKKHNLHLIHKLLDRDNANNALNWAIIELDYDIYLYICNFMYHNLRRIPSLDNVTRQLRNGAMLSKVLPIMDHVISLTNRVTSISLTDCVYSKSIHLVKYLAHTYNVPVTSQLICSCIMIESVELVDYFTTNVDLSTLDKCLSHAYKQGNVKIIELLITKGAGGFNSAILSALRGGHTDLVINLLPQVTNKHVVYICAIGVNNMDIIKLLIGQYNDIEAAMMQSSLDTVTYLVEYHKDKEPFDYDKLVKKSINRDRTDITEYLLNNFTLTDPTACIRSVLLSSVPKDILDKLVKLGGDLVSCITNDDFEDIDKDTLRYLIDNDIISKLPSKLLDDIVTNFYSDQNVHIALLREYKRIGHTVDYDKLLVSCAESNRSDVITYLLDNETIGQDQLNRVLYAAINSNEEEYVCDKSSLVLLKRGAKIDDLIDTLALNNCSLSLEYVLSLQTYDTKALLDKLLTLDHHIYRITKILIRHSYGSDTLLDTLCHLIREGDTKLVELVLTRGVLDNDMAIAKSLTWSIMHHSEFITTILNIVTITNVVDYIELCARCNKLSCIGYFYPTREQVESVAVKLGDNRLLDLY